MGNEVYLILEDGSVFCGSRFGSKKNVCGEVVFNTGMVGYTEAITDPSYKGQILCQTYPLVGNYGINPDDFESDSPKIEGYIVSEACAKPSHRSSKMPLTEFLAEHEIPGIAGIDTRALTKKLRTHGVMLGIISDSEDAPDKIPDPNETDLVEKVTIGKPVFYENPGKKVVVIDCGVKMNIIRFLLERKLNVVRVPASYTADKIMALNPDGILISNGPGDPKKIDYVIDTAGELIEYKMPVFGICLGIQILSLALNGNTYKLKFGHRGQNHTCMDIRTKRCFITSQNHGYAVDANSLGDCKVTMLNVNDRTVEGMEHRTLPVFGVQFHPEASPGPTDTRFLFDKFTKMMVND